MTAPSGEPRRGLGAVRRASDIEWICPQCDTPGTIPRRTWLERPFTGMTVRCSRCPSAPIVVLLLTADELR